MRARGRAAYGVSSEQLDRRLSWHLQHGCIWGIDRACIDGGTLYNMQAVISDLWRALSTYSDDVGRTAT